MTPQLTIRSMTFPLADQAGWTGAAAPADLSENERLALAFCREWLSGPAEFVVQTSGSTGEPKPIALKREQMIASALATGAALDLRPRDRALVCLPVRYIAGRMMLVRGLVLDLDMTLVEPGGDPFATLPPDARFDFMAVVPLQLRTLLAGPASTIERLNAMTAILVGGGPIGATLEEQIGSLAAPVYHTYGMTETATHIALRRLNGPAASPDFYPLPGVALDTDERGCLRIQGPMTLGQWIQTNDLAELHATQPHLPENPIDATAPTQPAPSIHADPLPALPAPPSFSFRWLGRWDNVINTGGVKIHVEQVEAVLDLMLREFDLETRRFFIGALPDERLGQIVAAVVEGAPWPADVEAGLRSAVAERLGRFAQPRRFVYLHHLAETPTGKIDRTASLERAVRHENG